MGKDGTAIAIAGKRVIALSLLLGALTVLALLLGTGSAHASEKGSGHALGSTLRSGHDHLVPFRSHATKQPRAARSHSHKVRHHVVNARRTTRHATRHATRELTARHPVRRVLTPVTNPTTPPSRPADHPATSPVRDEVRDVVGTVRSTQPGKRAHDVTLLVQKTTGDVRRTAQQLGDKLLPSVLPPDVPGLPIPPLPAPDSDHPAGGSAPASNASDSVGVGPRVDGGNAPAVAPGADLATSSLDATGSPRKPSFSATIGSAVSALRDLQGMPSPVMPSPANDGASSSSAALFAGLLGAALLFSLVAGLARLRSRRLRLVPNPTYPPGSSPD